MVYKTADDLYYPIRKYNSKTGLTTVTLSDGKKVTYNAKNKEEYDKYHPLKKKDPETGSIYYTNKDGTLSYALKASTQDSTKMLETDDAMSLVSIYRNPKEIEYAKYANSMKALANEARLEKMATPISRYDREAAKKYKDEVDSLKQKLNIALMNAPVEREALRVANVKVTTKLANNPDMSKEDVKKEKQKAVTSSRQDVGSVTRKKRNIVITDKEWEAIQAGAVSDSKLRQILDNTDSDALKERATPKRNNGEIRQSQISRIKQMSKSNYSLEEIARATGVSTSTVSKYLKGGN